MDAGSATRGVGEQLRESGRRQGGLQLGVPVALDLQTQGLASLVGGGCRRRDRSRRVRRHPYHDAAVQGLVRQVRERHHDAVELHDFAARRSQRPAAFGRHESLGHPFRGTHAGQFDGPAPRTSPGS